MSKYVGHLPQSFGKDKRLFFGYAGNKNYEKNYDRIFGKKNTNMYVSKHIMSKILVERNRCYKVLGKYPKSIGLGHKEIRELKEFITESLRYHVDYNDKYYGSYFDEYGELKKSLILYGMKIEEMSNRSIIVGGDLE